MKIAILGINIFDLIIKYFPVISQKDYRIQKSTVILINNPMAAFFTNSELIQVNQFKTFKRQIEWIGGRLAIKRLIEKFSEETTFAPFEIDNKNSGVPFLKKFFDWNISISHSGQLAFGAVGLHKSIRLGIDVEEIKDIKKSSYEALLKVGFSAKERNYLRTKPIEALYKNWTIKESFLKYIKKGFNEDLMKVEIIDDKIYYNNRIIDDIVIKSQRIYNYMFSYVYKKMKKNMEIFFYEPENIRNNIKFA